MSKINDFKRTFNWGLVLTYLFGLIVAAAAIIGFVSMLTGCEVHRTTAPDPNTGEPVTKTTYGIDDEKSEKIEAGVQTAITTAEALRVVWPGFGLAAGGLGVLLRAWRKAKKELVFQTEDAKGWRATASNVGEKRSAYYKVLGAVVRAVDAYRKGKPGNWPVLKKALIDEIGNGTESENILRDIRSLPRK